jgi:hypothetical protein
LLPKAFGTRENEVEIKTKEKEKRNELLCGFYIIKAWRKSINSNKIKLYTSSKLQKSKRSKPRFMLIIKRINFAHFKKSQMFKET